jgi:hypothetical protein
VTVNVAINVGAGGGGEGASAAKALSEPDFLRQLTKAIEEALVGAGVPA